jgi:hypothetical protein
MATILGDIYWHVNDMIQPKVNVTGRVKRVCKFSEIATHKKHADTFDAQFLTAACTSALLRRVSEHLNHVTCRTRKTVVPRSTKKLFHAPYIIKVALYSDIVVLLWNSVSFFDWLD